jgi:hypothetical protein
MCFVYRMFLTPGTQTDICSYSDAGVSCNFPSACSASCPETVSVLSSPSTQGVYSSQGTQGSDVTYQPGDSEEIEYEHERLVNIVCTSLTRCVYKQNWRYDLAILLKLKQCNLVCCVE